jgi:hypothetical protein
LPDALLDRFRLKAIPFVLPSHNHPIRIEVRRRSNLLEMSDRHIPKMVISCRKWLLVVRRHFSVQAHADLPLRMAAPRNAEAERGHVGNSCDLGCSTLYRGLLRFGGVEMVRVEEPLVKMPSGFVVASLRG